MTILNLDERQKSWNQIAFNLVVCEQDQQKDFDDLLILQNL